MGGAILAGRLGVVRAFGQAAGRVKQQSVAIRAEFQAGVGAGTINVQHPFEGFQFQGDGVGHKEYIIRKIARAFDYRGGIS